MDIFLFGILVLLLSCVITFTGVIDFFLIKEFIKESRPEALLFALLVFATGHILSGLVYAALRRSQGERDFKGNFLTYLMIIRYFPRALLYIVWYGGGLFLLILTFYCLKESGRELGVYFAVTVLWIVLTYFGHKALRKIVLGNIDPDSIEWPNSYYEKDSRTIVAAVEKCDTNGTFSVNRKKGVAYCANVLCTAFYDEENGELMPAHGYLHWFVRNQTYDNCGIIKGFTENGLYRVRVREKKKKNTDGTEEHQGFWLEKIVDKKVQCPELQAYVDEYNKPIIVKDDFFGELEYDKTEERFKGEMKLGEDSIGVYIYAENEPEKWEAIIKNAAEHVGDISELDEKCRRYAAQNIDEVFDEDSNELSEQAIYDDLSPVCLDIYDETEIIAVYGSDNLFGSPEIRVSYDKEKGSYDWEMEC